MNESIQQRHKAISDRRSTRRARLEAMLKSVESQYSAELTQLEVDCVAAGGHHDNGGFMHGFCSDCGAFLG